MSLCSSTLIFGKDESRRAPACSVTELASLDESVFALRDPEPGSERDGRVVNAVSVSQASVLGHVDAGSGGRVRFPGAGRLLQGRFPWFPFLSGEC